MVAMRRTWSALLWSVSVEDWTGKLIQVTGAAAAAEDKYGKVQGAGRRGEVFCEKAGRDVTERARREENVARDCEDK